MLLINVAESLGKFWYWLTAYVPRRLPRTPGEFDHLKQILIGAYGVPDEPSTWITVAGQIQSTPGHKLRKPFGDIANQVKRLAVNNLAQAVKTKMFEALNTKLKAAIDTEIARAEAEGTHGQEKAPEQPKADADPVSPPN